MKAPIIPPVRGYVVTVHSMLGSMGEACESMFTVLTTLRTEAEEIRNLLVNITQQGERELYVTWCPIDIDLEVAPSRDNLLDEFKKVLAERFDDEEEEGDNG